MSLGDHVRLRDLPAQHNVLNEFSLCEAIELNKLRKFKQVSLLKRKSINNVSPGKSVIVYFFYLFI